MKLIDAAKFFQFLNESNIGTVVSTLTQMEDEGKDLSDQQTRKINHVIATHEDELKPIIQGLADSNISTKINADIFSDLMAKIESNRDWYRVISTLILNRNKKDEGGFTPGITFDDFIVNEPVDLMQVIKSKFGFTDEDNEILTELSQKSSGGNKTSQGPFELFLALAGENGKLDNGRSQNGHKGDIWIGGKALEIKCSNIGEGHIAKKTGEITQGANSLGGVLLPIHNKAERINMANKAFTKFNNTLKKFNPEFINPITYSPYKGLDSNLIETIAGIEAPEDDMKKALRDVYVEFMMTLFAESDRNFIAGLIDADFALRGIQEMIKTKRVITLDTKRKILFYAGAASLKHYHSVEKFNGILIVSNIAHQGISRAVFFGDKELNMPMKNLAEFIAGSNKIRFEFPRFDGAGRDGIQVLAN